MSVHIIFVDAYSMLYDQYFCCVVATHTHTHTHIYICYVGSEIMINDEYVNQFLEYNGEIPRYSHVHVWKKKGFCASDLLKFFGFILCMCLIQCPSWRVIGLLVSFPHSYFLT